MSIADFQKPYNPTETEEKIYREWEESGFFNPDVCVDKGVTKSDAPVFSIILPPPNITGRLHLGHVLEQSLQDTTVRFERMRGKRTLWVPGTDHAAIATQARFEKELYKEQNKSRHDFPRDVFFKMIHEFGLKNQADMQRQMRNIGASLDWSREAFTLDQKRALAVRRAFKNMFDAGLIYRGLKVVNWDPKGQTTISDDEIVYEERDAILYTFKYSKDFPIPISTTRLETKVGDTGVAVHPEDPRYKEFIGKEYDLQFAGVPLHIKVVGDYAADPEFGTGAVGVTPAHSMADAEMAQRHDLEAKKVINEFAKMDLPDNPELNGKKVLEAREMVVDWLKQQDLLIKEEKVKQNISTAERTGGIVEPLPKLQWFIDVNKTLPSHGSKTLKELMREPVETGAIKIMPDRYGKIYFHWIDHLRDWCISRQIIYGHQIPVWYKEENVYCGLEAPEGEGWVQDTDTLDTWFSSGLWSFSTLGWPEQTQDLKTYHPTSLLNTGHEILFFWVARMIMMSQFHLKQIPFRTVYIHGLVRDKQGRKFSKSLKNGVEPEEVIKDYGTDALRMSMIVGVGPGSDLNFDIQKVSAYKKFANKVWNASRFVLENTNTKPGQLSESDRALLDEFKKIAADITEDMENYRFYLAAEKIYHYFWHTFADIIIEAKKKDEDKFVLRILLEELLKILHPFMPFITERIWKELGKDNLLMVEPWPIE